MRVYAGIDEAGYGPMFGPLVIGCSVFALDDDAEPTPNLWRLLNAAVCRGARDKKKRIAIDDSKKLFTRSAGLKHLERCVLAVLRWSDRPVDTLEQLLATVGADDDSCLPDLLWYGDGAESTALPACHEEGTIAIAAAQLRRAGQRAAVAPLGLRTSVVYEDRFNRLVKATGSKPRCAWAFISQHLAAILQDHGEHRPHVVVDRQGGRQHYRRWLQTSFPEAQLRVMDESSVLSRYELTDDPRSLVVSFQVQADGAHLPAALASMTAKYVRELLMARFNRFWMRQIPDLKPTAGYVQDGRRFLKQIEAVADRLGVRRDQLIRAR